MSRSKTNHPGLGLQNTTLAPITWFAIMEDAELSYGFMKGSRRELNEKKLHQIIDQLKMAIIAVDQHVARKYGIIYTSLVKKGRRIPIHDAWIAACCMETGGTLLTRDTHFEFIDRIETIVVKAPPSNLEYSGVMHSQEVP